MMVQKEASRVAAPPRPEADGLCINTLRFLAADAVEAAKSGHPGLPLGAAPMAYVLWDRFLKHNPRDPKWPDRDRFLLSAGHGSALLYSLLHVYGYDLPIEELKRFRQWESKTPGHPEYGLTPGVEATTGPLGQGFGMGVGMAIAERFLGALFNQPGFEVVNHYTYALVSDGDLMEGVASEAASYAGTLHLGKLIYLYDDNHITIEGDTRVTFTENVRARFEAYGWHVQKIEDGNDLVAIDHAIRAAQADPSKPSLIIIRTHIGFGSPKQDTGAVHGEALGPEAAKVTKENLGWPLEPTFYVQEEAATHFRKSADRSARAQAEWDDLFDSYVKQFPEKAAQFSALMAGELPVGWDNDLPSFPAAKGPMATRSASGTVMNELAKTLPTLIGGSADLGPSNKTTLNGLGDFEFDGPGGRNLHFGVREHAMGTMINGMALHGGIRPFGATFLIFSDYMRPAIRLASLMKVPSLFVFTHDSVALGEDGPTHQPIEHLMSLRAMPGLTLIRPADANETVAAWRVAITMKTPVAFALTRQNLPVLDPVKYPVMSGVPKGAYILSEAAGGAPDVILIASGSEVHLILQAQDVLSGKGVKARVVSMPSWELFNQQTAEYRRKVLPNEIPKLAVEAGATLGWRNYVGDTGAIIGLDRFGASAPGDVALKNLGFNVENVVQHALGLLKRNL